MLWAAGRHAGALTTVTAVDLTAKGLAQYVSDKQVSTVSQKTLS